MARVLAVDDQELNLELLAAYLSGTECELVLAHDGFQALDAIAAGRPDLVLLDVLVTSLNTVEDRVRALQLGADDFLAKPIDRNELMARVVTLIKTKEVYDKLDDAEHVMAAFAKIVEAKDGGTEAHVERVARGARALGEAAGLSEMSLDAIYFGGIVHDIGKIGVADSVLLKPGPLSGREVELVRRHVSTGVEIASQLRSACNVVPIIKHHHERFDGTGYPDGLA